MSKQLTEKEFYEQYGDVLITFSYYYKYTFYYTGITKEGYDIRVGYGGNHDQIYRHDVGVGVQERVRTLEPYTAVISSATEELFTYYNYLT